MTRAEKVMTSLLTISIILNLAFVLTIANVPLPKISQQDYSMQPQFEECMAGWKNTIADLNAHTARLNAILGAPAK